MRQTNKQRIAMQAKQQRLAKPIEMLANKQKLLSVYESHIKHTCHNNVNTTQLEVIYDDKQNK